MRRLAWNPVRVCRAVLHLVITPSTFNCPNSLSRFAIQAGYHAKRDLGTDYELILESWTGVRLATHPYDVRTVCPRYKETSELLLLRLLTPDVVAPVVLLVELNVFVFVEGAAVPVTLVVAVADSTNLQTAFANFLSVFT